MDAKPWQIAVVVIGLLGACVLFAWNVFGGRDIRRPDEILLMDVVTGDRYLADVSGKKSVFIPEKHPDTGEYTLIPIDKDESGVWHIRYLELLKEFPPEKLGAVEDVATGVAKPSSASPKRFRR